MYVREFMYVIMFVCGVKETLSCLNMFVQLTSYWLLLTDSYWAIKQIMACLAQQLNFCSLIGYCFRGQGFNSWLSLQQTFFFWVGFYLRSGACVVTISEHHENITEILLQRFSFSNPYRRISVIFSSQFVVEFFQLIISSYKQFVTQRFD